MVVEAVPDAIGFGERVILVNVGAVRSILRVVLMRAPQLPARSRAWT
jgi:hypothetical protein